MSKLLENFLQSLYTDLRSDAKEWRGANRPTGDDSNRPNLIRQCFTLESSKMKINCLRKLRDEAAMNPFYQARLDRFVDAITQTWEPTDKPGTIPGNEFKETAVGEDLKENVGANIMIASVLDNIYSKYGTAANTYAHHKCGKILQDDVKKNCTLRVKIEFKKKMLKELQSKRPLCKQAKNPERCRKQIKRKIAFVNIDIRTLQSDFNKLSKQRKS